jgi:hypothetical protein
MMPTLHELNLKQQAEDIYNAMQGEFLTKEEVKALQNTWAEAMDNNWKNEMANTPDSSRLPITTRVQRVNLYEPSGDLLASIERCGNSFSIKVDTVLSPEMWADLSAKVAETFDCLEGK